MQLLKVHPDDNVIVALRDFEEGEQLDFEGNSILLTEKIPIKHKLTERAFEIGDQVIMYGVPVGRVIQPIPKGGRISTENIVHDSAAYAVQEGGHQWNIPDISHFEDRTFLGYHRKNGQVGTRNYWLVIPLVFCENRNLNVIEELMRDKLGYARKKEFSVNMDALLQHYKEGADEQTLLSLDLVQSREERDRNRLFPNVDGIKFLRHDGGCGGTRQDSEALCRLLAGYINHPNVAGATVLSLGCQNAQISLLEEMLEEIAPDFDKSLFILEQQRSLSEPSFIADAIKQTFVGMAAANKVGRKPAPISKLSLGLECGGSDGFSGISANPALGYCSDLLVALGGSSLLSEFPELNGVEQELINRCREKEHAEKFAHLMQRYSQRARESGSGFDMNPSPGNIRDGLITDAIKSAGAAKKGGTSPIVDVLDYTEQMTHQGLHLLCTPGNDVESTTGLAGSGANLIVFTTGLGTPTGNPIAPTVKMSTNNALAKRMRDIIDINAGTIISGEDTIQTKGEELLELLIQVANGEVLTKAEQLGQDDFIPWKRGVSL